MMANLPGKTPGGLRKPVIVQCGGFSTPILASPKILTVIVNKGKRDKLDGGQSTTNCRPQTNCGLETRSLFKAE